MRIIHINDKLTLSGGVEVYISQVCKLQQERRWKADWVAITREGSNRVRIESADPELCWEGQIGELGASCLARIVADETDCVFHVHSLSEPKVLEQLFALAPVVRKMADPRMVCPGNGKFWLKSEVICVKPMGLHCLLHAYTQKCCNRHPKRLIKAFASARYEMMHASRKYAKILANSSYSQELLLEMGVPADKIKVLWNFTAERPMDGCRGEGSTNIIYIGRLSRTKGVHFLIRAFGQVLDEFPEARLKILGDGIDGNYFRELTKELDLEKSVEFLGWADRALVTAELQTARVMAFPSIYPEAFGISGLEAMVHGKPVVGFDVGGVGDWLKHEKNGILVEPKNTRGLADGLKQVLRDPDLAERMGRAGRTLVMELFSPEVHLNALEEVYREVTATFGGHHSS